MSIMRDAREGLLAWLVRVVWVIGVIWLGKAVGSGMARGRCSGSCGRGVVEI
jgi:hypothetical protein